jgi:hypothetical protein
MRPTLVLPSALLLTVAAQSPASAGEVRTYTDRAVFLADTAAVSATGTLPNVGRVVDVSIDPLGTYTLGSVTFHLTAGSDNIAVGAAGTAASPDWYPPTAENELALGFERMQVSTAGPVYSIGFDFIEPDATVQPWGGGPQESTYEILLFDGPTLVGQAQFAGTAIPNDVVTFLGVWSDKPFNRVLVNDITGNDDDEYFGEFYTGTTPAGCTLNVGLAYAAGTLTMNFEIGTAAPRTWNVWFTWGESALIRLWTLPIPALPTVNVPVPVALPPLGTVGVLTTLTTATQGIVCSDFKTVATPP